jgi:hypothetical protein
VLNIDYPFWLAQMLDKNEKKNELETIKY